MPAILVVLSLVFLAAGFYRRGMGLRQSLIYASIPVSLFLVFLTETLSVFHALTVGWTIAAWAVFAVFGLLWMRAQSDNRVASTGFVSQWRDLGRTDRWMLLGLAVVAGLVGITALLSAPNTWDAMEYHMPRVIEWIGNRGVQLYPTIDRQQLSMPPFSEYVILHFQLLTGSDILANLVQWLSFVGCTIAVSLIARELGADRRGQILAAVISGTIETGILGASGTKNDYTLAFWIATAVFLLLQWKKRQDWLVTFAIASALSLSVFSKGTGYAFLPPMVVCCFLMWAWKPRKLFLARLPVLALVFLAINGPLWARNHAFSGSVLGLPYFDGAGPNEGRMFSNRHITFNRSLANVIRSVGLNLATPVGRVNALTVNVSSSAIRALGVDPSDPSQLVLSQLGYLPPFNIEFHPFSETQSGNQLHFLLLVAAGVLCFWKWRGFSRDLLWFAVGVAGSFVLYATLLRWSPWNARYQLPVFVLGAVVSALVMEKLLPRWSVAIAALLLFVAAMLAVRNTSRPLLDRRYSIVTSSRVETYFFDNHWFYADSFLKAADAAAAKSCNEIGIDANEMHFEYPMMALVNRDGKRRRLTYVSVNNPTTAYSEKDAIPPCTVICLECAEKQESQQLQKQYRKVETFGGMLVFSEPK